MVATSRTGTGSQLPFFTPYVTSPGVQTPADGVKSSLCYTPSHNDVRTELDPMDGFFSKLRGLGEPQQTIVFNKIPNAAEMRNWLDELKIKCAEGAKNPTKVVEWIQQVENDNNQWEDFGCLGRCYDPYYNAL